MTLSKNFQISLQVSVSAILIFSLILYLPSQSGSLAVGLLPSRNSSDQSVEGTKMVIGSKPPGCVNKCMNCQPCKATLVIPPHQNKGFRTPARREDGSYYLLSWKCKCGNKLFQP